MQKGRKNPIDNRWHEYPTCAVSYRAWIAQPTMIGRFLSVEENEALTRENVARRLKAHRETKLCGN